MSHPSCTLAGMCSIRDGADEQPLFDRIDTHVAAGLWALQGVNPDRATDGSTLSACWRTSGQPELVPTGGNLGSCAGGPQRVGERVERGLRVDASSVLDLDGYVIEFETVHPSYLAHGCAPRETTSRRGRGSSRNRFERCSWSSPLTDWCDVCDRKRRCLATPGTPDSAVPATVRHGERSPEVAG